MSKLYDFVNRVAKDYISNLSDEEKEYMMDIPDSFNQHFGVGMYIRNKYIHGKKETQNFGDPDYLSSIIVERIFSMLLPEEYDYGDTLTKAFFENKQFLNLRKVYKKIYGDYPKGFVKRAKEYVKLTQDEKYNIAYYSETDIKAYVKELAKELWHEEQFVAESEKKGIEYKEIAVYVENIKSIYEEMGCFLPLEISWLTVPEKITKEEYQLFQIKIMSAINDNIRIVEMLNSKYFEDKMIAMVALRCSWTMKYMPMWQNDDEMVWYAAEQGCSCIEYVADTFLRNREFVLFAVQHSENEVIMHYEEMKLYRSDKEIALWACEVNAGNFAYIDGQLQDDYKVAEIAIKNTHNSSVYSWLGPTLKENRQLALLECDYERPDTENFIDAFKNDDEIAEKIIRLHGKKSWSLYWMSERIQKKYMVGRYLNGV